MSEEESKSDVKAIQERFAKDAQEVSAIRERANNEYRHESGEQYTPMLRDLRFLLGQVNLIGELWDSAEREADELHALNTTQAESIETFQSQFRVMKEAIEAAMNWFVSLGYDDELVAQLRSAITPKGSEQ